jgi:hypothetical protein
MTLKIFKANNGPDGNGTVVDFTAAMVAGAAASYDPAIHEAPIVLGHPRTDAPAYGWIDSAAEQGGALFAEPKQLHAEFAEAVAAGSYKKISTAFYMPGNPYHPIPDSEFPYIKHVGFLGATPPVIKGLGSAEFAEFEPEEGVYYAEMDAEDTEGELMNTLGMALQNLREYILAKDDAETADRVLPQSLIEAVRASADELQDDIEEAAEPDPYPMTPMPSQYAESEDPKLCKTCGQPMPKKTPADAAYAEREQSLADRESALKKAEYTQYCEGLMHEGRAGVAGVLENAVALMMASPTDVEYAEGELSIADRVKQILSAIPKTIEFGESAPRSKEAPFTARSTADVAARARKMAEDEGISTAEAVLQIHAAMEV